MGLRDRLRGLLERPTHLAESSAAPEIGVPDTSGKTWKINDLRGRVAVIYFYPKDDTPGCTKEACAFRDATERFGNIALFGVSTDAVDSHRAFAQKFNLGFPLLADTTGEMAKRWGVLGRGGTARRATFVIDREGRISRIFDPASVDGHAEAVLAAVRELP